MKKVFVMIAVCLFSFSAWSSHLYEAVESNDIETVRELIKIGVSIDIKYDGRTLLHQASYLGNINMAALLIDNGANVNAKDEDGSTPLHQASLMGNIKTASLLIDNGAKVNVRDRSGKTPLDFAIEKGWTEIIKLLEKYKN